MSSTALPAAASTPRRRAGADLLVPALLLLAFAAIPLLAVLGSEKYLISLATRVMIFAVAAVALDLIVGYGALVSFGHAAFIGLGAYAAGIAAAHGITDAALSLPLAFAISMLFAWPAGIVCLRGQGVYFIMITLVFGQMV